MSEHSLWTLSTLMQKINRRISDADGEIDDEQIEREFDETYPELESKLRAYGWVIETAKDEIRSMDVWLDRIKRRHKAATDLVGRLSQRMAEAMGRAEIKRIEGNAPVSIQAVRELAEKARGLSKAADRAARDQILDQIIGLLGDRPTFSWETRLTPGAIDTDPELNLDALRGLSALYGVELVVDPPRPPAPPARLDKVAAKKLINSGTDLPGVSIKTEWRLYDGE